MRRGPAVAVPLNSGSPLGDLIESAVRKLVTSTVIAGGVIALAIYARPSPPRYQVTAADGRIVRIDTRTGTVIACVDSRCAVVLRRGQELEDSLPAAVPARPAIPAPSAAPQPALPAPQPAPQPTPTPAPATR